MPIKCFEQVRAIEQEDFHQIDKRVMRVAFDVHNEFGRFLDESLFQEEIASRCRFRGLTTTREMRIRVTHEDFKKEYEVDLLVENGVVVEMKTVEILSPVHEAQLLNYLFLTGTQFGSLINLGSTSVKRRFVSTSMTPNDRRQLQVVDVDWHPIVPQFVSFRERMMTLLQDWGACLELNIYRDGMVHFLGGADKVIKTIPICSQSRIIGRQKVHIFADDFAFLITALRKGQDAMREHQSRFLSHTELRGIAWINLNGQTAEFRTVSNNNNDFAL